MKHLFCVALCAYILLLTSDTGLAHRRHAYRQRRDVGATDFGLPANNTWTSEFNARRVTRKNGEVVTVSKDYVLNPQTDKYIRTHHGGDLSSRDADGNRTSLEFKTPVGGTVSYDPKSSWNTVTVNLDNGKALQFLHAAKVTVRDGQRVEPGTALGLTGGTGPKTVTEASGGTATVKSTSAYTTHLHVQAKDKFGQYTDPRSVITESRQSAPAQAAEKPGGVLLDKAAEVLGDISDVTGAFYDAKQNRVVLLGRENAALPPMDPNLLATALRAAYLGEAPGVSIDPSPDTRIMRTRYLGQTRNTLLGLWMFEADRILKTYSLGRDNFTDDRIASRIPGYRSILERETDDPQGSAGQALYRLWFKPKEMTLQRSADGRSMRFTAATIDCSWEQMEGVPAPGTAVRAFVQHINQNYDAYAQEQPVLQELVQLAKTVALARWLRDNSLFLDPSGLSIPAVATPETTPAITTSVSMRGENVIRTLSLTGGVDFSKENDYRADADGQAAGLGHSALRARPHPEQVSWNFRMDGETYTAVAFPVVSRTLPRRLVRQEGRWTPIGPLLTQVTLDGTRMTLYGQNLGASRGMVTFKGAPLAVLQWTPSRVTVRAPVETGEGPLVLASNGQRSNPILLHLRTRVVPEPPALEKAVVEVVNSTGERLTLRYQEQKWTIAAGDRLTLTLSPGRYTFEASIGGPFQPMTKEFTAGRNSWTFTKKTEERAMPASQTGTLTLMNPSGKTLTVTITGAERMTFSLGSASKTLTLRPGTYTVSARRPGVLYQPQTYSLEAGKILTITFPQ